MEPYERELDRLETLPCTPSVALQIAQALVEQWLRLNGLVLPAREEFSLAGLSLREFTLDHELLVTTNPWGASSRTTCGVACSNLCIARSTSLPGLREVLVFQQLALSYVQRLGRVLRRELREETWLLLETGELRLYQPLDSLLLD
jgi:hypothetical protein